MDLIINGYNMSIYTIEIKDTSAPMFPCHNLTGNFCTPTIEKAIKEAKNWYAHELDTDAEQIQIISVIKQLETKQCENDTNLKLV